MSMFLLKIAVLWAVALLVVAAMCKAAASGDSGREKASEFSDAA
jgi:hypothetical protein